MRFTQQLQFNTVRAISLGALAAAYCWCFWPTLEGLMREWRNDQDYSVGQIVAPIALCMVWARRSSLKQLSARPSPFGFGIVAAGVGFWVWGASMLLDSVQRYSIILVAIGLVIAITGLTIFWKIKISLLFLFLMVPLPGRVHNLVSGPLQNIATVSAFFVLELFGVTVAREGNTLLLNHSVPIAIAEACSGLRMLTAFVVVAATFAFFACRLTLLRVLIVLSSIPIAIFCNLVRLVVTALLFLHLSGEAAERFFHDFAGWLMMPLAIVLLLIEHRVLLTLLNVQTAPSCAAKDEPQLPTKLALHSPSK